MNISSIASLAMEFLGFCVEILLWWVFWSFVVGIIKGYLERNNPPAERDALVQKVMTLIHRIKQEQHGECYYWFDADTDEFLAQGATDSEIKEQLKQRFKGHAFILDDKRALAGPDLKVITLEELKLNKNQTIA
jgi:hypothetical protein